MDINDSKIAIVHDWFLKKSFGGAEKVTILLDQYLNERYSKPDIFALSTNLDKLENKYLEQSDIKTSFIQNLPFGKRNVQKFLPILPFAIEQIDLRNYDFVLSSSHSFAKGVITSPDQLHISYVHTPVRYAWDQMNTYLEQSTLSKFGFEIPLRYFLYKLREWDFTSSQRIDYIIANSYFTAKRIKKYWGITSKVIHPPVDIKRFKYNKTREDFYLSVNRLVPNKRIDLLVKSFNKLGLPLVIIGDGPERLKLERIANPNIKFLKKTSNRDVENYMSRCKAFVYAGLEDFGIAPVEAMASGAPIIAFGKGGILDTVNCLTNSEKNEFPNGILFKKQTSSNLTDTISWFEEKKIWKNFNAEDLNNYSLKFDSNNFINKIDLYIKETWESFHKKL